MSAWPPCPLLMGYAGEITAAERARTDEERLRAKNDAEFQRNEDAEAEVNSWRARGYKKKERVVVPLFIREEP